ncbi:iron permease FTR1 family-domain-containing protein [Tribonema minus]|uniref:Iron permease FTR1 family-domain-containing protein n=1 Tax=Tribonema minus TaxID=303371 RepID=A0A835YQM0_9STRA|nr:iron permease FTR1 family-domain-containing protein [Tribonema minus]
MLKMSKFQEAWEAKLRAQLEKADAEGTTGTSLRKSQMFWIPFISVLREGIETVIFLAGVGAGYPLKSIPIPGIVGLITGLIAGWLLFAAGGKCSMKGFLVCSTVLLLFISGGLALYGAHEFQEAGMFGAYENDEGEIQGAMNEPVWNICDCCNQADKGWDVFNRLFGYTCAPSPWEILVYCLYWVLALTYLCFKIRALCFRGLASKDEHLTPAKDMSPLSADAAVAGTAAAAPISGKLGADVRV